MELLPLLTIFGVPRTEQRMKLSAAEKALGPVQVRDAEAAVADLNRWWFGFEPCVGGDFEPQQSQSEQQSESIHRITFLSAKRSGNRSVVTIHRSGCAHSQVNLGP